MMLRDARGESHDLGARRTFAPSMMKIAVGYGEEPTGRWQSHALLFSGERPSPKTQADRQAYNRDHRAENADHYREMERARSARARERRRAATAA